MYYQTLSTLEERERRPEVRNSKQFDDFQNHVGLYYSLVKEFEVVDDYERVRQNELEIILENKKRFMEDTDETMSDIVKIKDTRKRRKNLLIKSVETTADQMLEDGAYLQRWHNNDPKRKNEMYNAIVQVIN